MFSRKLKVFLIALILVLALVVISVFLYELSQEHKVESDVVLGFVSALVGGLFTLISVWVTQELEKIRSDYDQLPLKIRSISQLRDMIWEVKSKVGQETDCRDKVEILLDIGSSINGNVFSRCVNIRDKYIRYHNNMRWEPDAEGISILIRDEEFRSVRNELQKVLEDEGKYLVDLEDKLIKKFR